MFLLNRMFIFKCLPQFINPVHALGVPVTPYVRLFGADRDTVYFQHVITGEAVECSAETLVLCSGHASASDLFDEFNGEARNIHAIGDCLSPRTAEEAVLEGLRVGASL